MCGIRAVAEHDGSQPHGRSVCTGCGPSYRLQPKLSAFRTRYTIFPHFPTGVADPRCAWSAVRSSSSGITESKRPHFAASGRQIDKRIVGRNRVRHPGCSRSASIRSTAESTFVTSGHGLQRIGRKYRPARRRKGHTGIRRDQARHPPLCPPCSQLTISFSLAGSHCGGSVRLTVNHGCECLQDAAPVGSLKRLT